MRIFCCCITDRTCLYISICFIVIFIVIFVNGFYKVRLAGDTHNKEDHHLPIALRRDKNCSAVTLKEEDFPQIIHQMWKTDKLPKHWKILADNCQKINPTFEYKLWSNEDIDQFVTSNYPWFVDTYNHYRYAVEKHDAARYFILYHYGGVYIDMDMECKLPFADIVKNASSDSSSNVDVILGATAPLGVTNSFMMAKRKHSFMKYLMDNLQASNGWYGSPYWTVMFSTGPLYVWGSYRSYPCQEQIHVLSVHLHTNVYLDHKHASTWHQWDGPIWVFIDNNYNIFLLSLLMLFAASGFFLITKYQLYHPKKGLMPWIFRLVLRCSRQCGRQLYSRPSRW